VRAQLTSILSVASSLLVGLGLAWAPWTSLWEMNIFLDVQPGLRSWLLNPYIRGAVMGVGLVNVILAFEEMSRQWKRTVERQDK
jgi:hypothetical protein